MSETSYPRVGVAVFVWKDDQFLVQKRLGSHGASSWSLPGGHLELGETIEATARREVFEELGLRIKNLQLLTATNDIFKAEAKHYVTIWFNADWASGKPENKEPDRTAEMKWTDFKHLPRPLFQPCWRNLRKARPDLFS